MEIRKKHKCFDGKVVFATHESKSTKTPMNFSFYKPDGQVESAIIWLSGLTCTEENFMTKAGVQALLKDTKTMIICPDTSPRGLDISGSEDSYDFGTAASFYVNATEAPYKENYQMYDYITEDLIELLREEFSISKYSIMGHSMGGHGALVIGLRNPDLFRAVSAFSPIVNPINCPWGQKAMRGYLGDNEDEWKNYDSCELLKVGHKHPEELLIDQGLADEFYPEQLLTERIENISREVGQKLTCDKSEGYDHSYYFISTFLPKHIKHHLNLLN